MVGLESLLERKRDGVGECCSNDGRGRGPSRFEDIEEDDDEKRLCSCRVGEMRLLISSTDIRFVGER